MIKIILLMNPVYVTLFWAVVLSFYRSRKHTPKIFLGKFMFVAFVLYISHYFYFTGQYKVYHYLDSIYTLASLAVYPLYHIYVRLLTVDRGFSPSVHLKYLALPVIVFLLHLSGYLLMDYSEAMYYLMAGISVITLITTGLNMQKNLLEKTTRSPTKKLPSCQDLVLLTHFTGHLNRSKTNHLENSGQIVRLDFPLVMVNRSFILLDH